MTEIHSSCCQELLLVPLLGARAHRESFVGGRLQSNRKDWCFTLALRLQLEIIYCVTELDDFPHELKKASGY